MFKPRRYQLDCVDFLDEHNGRGLVADDMGLGKTVESLLWADDNRSVRPIIVVCPASVKYQWQAEALTHFGIRAEVLSGKKRPRKRNGFHKHPMLIINYEILEAWLPFLKRYGALLLIIDEIHRIKNPNAKCSTAVRELSYGIPHIIELGGTPLENHPAELWHPLHILAPKRFKNYLNFAFKYCRVKRTPWDWKFYGSKRPKKLRKILKRYMIRRLKRDVLKELPPKTRFVVPVEMANRREYQKALTDFRSWLDKTSPKAAVKYKRKSWKAEQRVKLGYIKRLVAELKLKAVFDWIDNYLQESNDKLVVFAIHHKIVDALYKRYSKIAVQMTGETPGAKRQQAIQKFVKDDKTRLFIANVQAGGVGVNGLQLVCNTVVTVEFDFKPSTHNQADDRLDRMGQKKKVFAYYLVAKDSMEVKLCELLQDKQETVDEVMDGKTREKKLKKKELDIYDQLCEVMRKDKAFF